MSESDSLATIACCIALEALRIGDSSPDPIIEIPLGQLREDQQEEAAA